VLAEYGVVQAAGSVRRNHLDAAGHLYRDEGTTDKPRPYQTGAVRDPAGKLHANLLFLGNLSALRVWYRAVRSRAGSADAYAERCREGALRLLDGAIAERRKRLRHWAGLVGTGEEVPRVFRDGSALEAELDVLLDTPAGEEALARIELPPADTYLEQIQNLSEADRESVRSILQQEIDRYAALSAGGAMETGL
jgi:hypothetical protein